MKITFLLTQSLESPGGNGRFFPLAKALVRAGHHVTIIALHHDFANAPVRTFTQDGVNVHYVAQMHVHKQGNHKSYYSPARLLWVTAVATWQLTWAAWHPQRPNSRLQNPTNERCGRLGGTPAARHPRLFGQR